MRRFGGLYMLSSRELEALSRSPLFQGYSPDGLLHLLGQIPWERREYAKGAAIYTPERFQKALAAVLSGQVLVTKGDGELVVSLLQAGDLFGAAALFNEAADYVSTLTARSPCAVLFFSQQAVRLLIASDARFRDNYIYYLSCRIRFLSDKIDALIQGTGERKLSGFLLRRMDPEGRVSVGCSMTELAARLNISRASLYRELQKLEARGTLRREGRVIFIQQPETLSRME